MSREDVWNMSDKEYHDRNRGCLDNLPGCLAQLFIVGFLCFFGKIYCNVTSKGETFQRTEIRELEQAAQSQPSIKLDRQQYIPQRKYPEYK